MINANPEKTTQVLLRLIYLISDFLQINDSYLMELITELQRLVNFPGLDEMLVSKYKNILEFYEECKNDRKYILEKIPMTCTVCTEILEHDIISMLQYKEIVNMVSYTRNLTQKSSSKSSHPPPIKFFSEAPQLPDPDPDPHSDSDSEDSSLDYILQNDSLISRLNDQTIHRSYLNGDSSSDFKDFDSKKSLDANSSDYNKTELISDTKVFSKPPWKRSPLQLVENSDEFSSNVSMNDNLIRSSSPVNNIIPKMNERATPGIPSIIFDQSREYDKIFLPSKRICSQPCPQDENHYSNSCGCDAEMMTLKNTLKIKENFQNKRLETDLCNSHTRLNIGHFQNPENDIKEPPNILKGDHNQTFQNRETKKGSYFTESTTDQNFYKQHLGMVEETNKNSKDQQRLLHQYSTSVSSLIPQNTQNITRQDLSIDHSNVANIRHIETLNQNSELQNYNLPNFEDLDKLEISELNIPNIADEQFL